MSNETQEGTIRYFNSQTLECIHSGLPLEKAADIWLALQKQIQDTFNPCRPIDQDPLSASERALYDATTKMLTEAAFPPMTYTVSELTPEEDE